MIADLPTSTRAAKMRYWRLSMNLFAGANKAINTLQAMCMMPCLTMLYVQYRNLYKQTDEARIKIPPAQQLYTEVIALILAYLPRCSEFWS